MIREIVYKMQSHIGCFWMPNDDKSIMENIEIKS